MTPTWKVLVLASWIGLLAVSGAAAEPLSRTGLVGPEMGVDLSAKPLRRGRAASDAVTGQQQGTGRSIHFPAEDVDSTGGGALDPGEATEIGGGPSQDAVSGGGYRLNFERAEIKDVVHAILTDTLGLNYTMGADVAGQITIASPRPLSRAELLSSLETVLSGQGFTMSKVGAGYRIAPLAGTIGNVSYGNNRQPGYGVSVVPLRYVSAAVMSRLVSGFVAEADGLRVDASRNTMVVKGPGEKRQEAVSAILAFDADWMRGQSVSLFELKRARPEAVVAELSQLFDTGENGASSGLIQFKPISRLRAVMALSKNAGLIRRAEGFVRQLDGASDAAEENVFVYKARYRDARELARVVNSLFGSGGSGGGMSGGLGETGGGRQRAGGAAAGLGMSSGMSSGGGASSGQSGGMGSGLSGSGGGSSSGLSGSNGQSGGSGTDMLKARFASAFGDDTSGASLGSGGGGMSGGMAGGNSLDLTQRGGSGRRIAISADPANNSVVTYTDGETYKKIQAALRRLDATPVQVAINVTIAEVRLTDQLKYGVQYYLDSGRIGMGQNKGSFGLLSAAAAGAGGVANKLGAAAGGGFNFMLGGYSGPDIVLSALDGFTDVKILSSPSLVVLENQPASLQVGDTVPITTSQAQGITVPGAPLVSQVEMRDTGIILNVIPRIGDNNAVMLQIEQEISAVVGSSNTLTPTISKRRVASTIAVPNGQTVLLAGLIQEKNQRGRDGIPFLNRLEHVGDLFSSTDNAAERTELVVFIRPVVVRSGRDAQVVAEDYRGKLYDAAERRGARAPRAAPVYKR